MAKSISLKQLPEILCLILLTVYSSLLMVLLQIFIRLMEMRQVRLI